MAESNTLTKDLVNNMANQTVYPVLFAISICHLLNDTIQSLVPAIYPILKNSFRLNFTQIGFITLGFQLSASLLQPFVGMYSDKNPKPFALVAGMCFTLIGLVSLGFAPGFGYILLAVCLMGIGSSIFHPEASRIAHMAAGEQRGLAQSVFQLGGNAGSSLGPLMASFIIVPLGQHGLFYFSLAAFIAIFIQYYLGVWYKAHRLMTEKKHLTSTLKSETNLTRGKVTVAISILLVLVFSKYFYLASLSSYYTFYLIQKFHISIAQSQLFLFLFLISAAAGTILGGPIGDRYGRKYVIWVSILGVAPFTMLLPHANLFWCAMLTIPIGLIISSAFSAILVYAQELIPGKVGMVSGLFFGFAFGMGGIGSALMGILADHKGIEYVFMLSSFLPLIGITAWFLPKQRGMQFQQTV